jgi:tetratricopeptide (TPR) repeat protein
MHEGINAIAQGLHADAVEVLGPAMEEAQAFPAGDLRRAEATLNLATAYQSQGQLRQAETLFLEAKRFLEPLGTNGRRFLGYAFAGWASSGSLRDVGRKPRSCSVRPLRLAARRGARTIPAPRRQRGTWVIYS